VVGDPGGATVARLKAAEAADSQAHRRLGGRRRSA
jgi:hypothetical protein